MSSSVKRILAATDGSATATRAVDWAAEMANRYEAELVLVQVVVPPGGEEEARVEVDDATDRGLAELAGRLAGARGRARVVVDPDPASAICRTGSEERVDVIVVGSVGMSGRREFLLGNVPNRVSHNAGCTVVIVNTGEAAERPTALGRLLGRSR